MFNLWHGLWPVQVDLICHFLKQELLNIAEGHSAKLYKAYGEKYDSPAIKVSLVIPHWQSSNMLKHESLVLFLRELVYSSAG